MEEEGNSTNNDQGNAKNILNCIDTEEKIMIDDEYLEQKVTIRKQLPTRIKIRLRDLLRTHANVFAWTTTHITGVPTTLIIGEENLQHRTSTEFVQSHRTGKTKEEKPGPRKKQSCPHLSKRVGGSRSSARKNLQKYRLKYVLDAYKGYHQMPMAEKDEEKTAFFTREGVFCSKRLPFSLKNTGATYQRLIDKVFGSQIGMNMEVNADDMVIKSDSEEEMLADIEETFGDCGQLT
uniref:Reverse transcriptase domain-containing protein n=1 Tax=Tanacetum cinerariifolium TaxID=118510 RepID=A0A699JRR6_TANCI|nr:hypothetical protein [Tanacetum cinerariifolium]